MKIASRVALAGVGAAAAAAMLAGPAFAAPAQAPQAAAAASPCNASTSGNTVNGSCTVSTPFGSFGATFSGTFGSNGYGSGKITLKGGAIGSVNGTWTGGPFTGGPATIKYTVQTPLGPVSGSVPVNI
ncbi:hypothetical protein J1792_27245 [Streptomyces triculaminicus]|uniref:Uncharacterized protein n=2 Tax=Streptomyces TaxID=1883 RepID=A0A939FUL4_9ACTN|nr:MULTISPECIES: hypothetical protein [Streptomyces]MBO0656335.1 hypothetical protein [Streptomyces triculaminicus]QSY50312.1 hypothetical protein J3S04_04560 [Streptomyces griseocarneus]